MSTWAVRSQPSLQCTRTLALCPWIYRTIRRAPLRMDLIYSSHFEFSKFTKKFRSSFSECCWCDRGWGTARLFAEESPPPPTLGPAAPPKLVDLWWLDVGLLPTSEATVELVWLCWWLPDCWWWWLDDDDEEEDDGGIAMSKILRRLSRITWMLWMFRKHISQSFFIVLLVHR